MRKEPDSAQDQRKTLPSERNLAHGSKTACRKTSAPAGSPDAHEQPCESQEAPNVVSPQREYSFEYQTSRQYQMDYNLSGLAGAVVGLVGGPLPYRCLRRSSWRVPKNVRW